jgi:hypothetical protein
MVIDPYFCHSGLMLLPECVCRIIGSGQDRGGGEHTLSQHDQLKTFD